MTYEDFSAVKRECINLLNLHSFFGDIVHETRTSEGSPKEEYFTGVFSNPYTPLTCWFSVPLLNKDEEPTIEYYGNGKINGGIFDDMRNCVTKIVDICNKWRGVESA